MNYKAIIVDDEINNLESLEALVRRHCSGIEVVGLAQSVDEGLLKINEHIPDLVFLDIKMPEKDGFQLLESLNNINFEVIIVTAFNHYAIKAIKFCAIDYLLKPVNSSELIQAVDMAIERIRQKRDNDRLRQLIQNMNSQTGKMKMGLASQSRVDFVETNQIIRCEAENNYTHVFLESGIKKTISKTLKEFEELLIDFGFIRVHQSHLINLSHIKSYLKNDGGYIEMDNSNIVPISRNRKEEIIKKIKNDIVI
jgi:two-component system, LytTR family, response regulator